MRLAGSLPQTSRAVTKARRRRKERAGRVAEFIAATFLIAKVRHRERCQIGESGLIAVRGRRLAFVAVQYRDEPADPGTPVAQQAIRPHRPHR